jgi:hypothetical protein
LADLKVEVDHSLLTALRAQAARRDLSVAALVRLLLDTIVTDRLTAAILDE